MEQLGGLILSKTITNQYKEKYRLAARGIIKKDNKVLMIYCKYFNDYTFAGGGLEENEDQVEGLKREIREELGINIKNIKFYCSVVEKNISMYKLHHNFIQTNNFFICEYDSECELDLEDYEVDLGFQKAYITVDDAIIHNEKTLQMCDKYRTKYLEKIGYNIQENDLMNIKRYGSVTGLKTTLYVLNKLKGDILNEGI